jgi:hypothetical protein
MKPILLFFLFVVLFFQSGCASPGVDEQMQQKRKESQSMRTSDTFGRGLQQ